MRIAIISNELPPYRVPLFEALGRHPHFQFHAIFCTRREPNRKWDLPPLECAHTFLAERFITRNGRYIHNNPDVIGALRRVAPDAVITTGFNPTHLYAFGFALFNRLPHIAMTDGTLMSERGLSLVHRTVRRIVYGRSKAFIHASEDGRRLYEHYGVPTERCFKSCLCIDNATFSADVTQQRKEFDFIFCGRIETIKNPAFAFDVAAATAKKLRRNTSILYVGAGDQEPVIREAAAKSGLVNVTFQEFTPHEELPAAYHAARIFLFPTRWDPWGVVLNEASAAGLPAIVSEHAGAGGELVRDGKNGFVCELEVDLWAERAALLLSRPELYREFSKRSRETVAGYSYANAVAGIVAACHYALTQKSGIEGKRAMSRVKE